MSNTPNLQLPYVAAGQSQKHVTVNEGLRALDALVHMGVVSRSLASPPTSPQEGQRYLVPVGAASGFAGHAGQIAAWQDGSWFFYTPRLGWLSWVADEALLLAYNGTDWVIASGQYQNLPMVGINATADTTNRLAVSSAASLLNHAGAGHQVKINKATAGDTASLLYQSNWSGRAEMGLSGDDRFRIKVSADGGSWVNALEVAPTGTMGLGTAPGNAALTLAGPLRVASYNVAGLPSASSMGAGALAMVSNESGGAVLAFSDGTNWRRVTDRQTVS
ncbi:MAG: DUF2793 domain-containing protein [Proteobacteria bacterium]|nr:DUF2793 domain-containing protein [Pseudomonadota bacterium]